ncbi:beta-secretase 2 [Hydra vulgaris]|uniref:Beta-secretase 2 n=1 Tax=Hydra vulgaris TaxID=6087 RepID=A0ABM4BGK6_HYDVU
MKISLLLRQHILLLNMVFHLLCLSSTSGDLGKVYDELGGRSYHLKRKTKQHVHNNHHLKGKNFSSTPRETKNRDQINENDHSYSLRSTSYAYIMEMELGTPAQKLEFLIDTGSANMAIAGPECRDEHGVRCKIENFYFPDKSSTSQRIGHPVETEYGKGSWSGDVYRDVVSFPGGPSIVAEFAVIKNEKEFFIKNSVNEGILGLAYKSLSSSQIEPLFDQLVFEKKAPDVFSLSLCNGNGRFWLDYPKPNEYHHPIYWTRVIHRAWYTVRMTGIDVAGESLGLSPYSYPPAIVDSGTTDILLEPEIYIAVIAMLKKRGPLVDQRFWNNYCVITDPFKWPYITIYLKDMRGGSFALTVLGKHYVRKQDQFYCLSIGAKQFGAVLGEVTLEGNVAIFDRANHRVGFAPSNLTDIESGAVCGNPVNINTTASGTLQDYCTAHFMPRISCHRTCDMCIAQNGAWCPKGSIYLWINGVKSTLDGSLGFCWLGNLYTLESTRYQTYLDGHGSVEFELECFSMLPMYKQCVLRGEWLFAIVIVGVFTSSILCLCLCCRKVYEVDAREQHPIYNNANQKEQFPVYNSLHDRNFR